MGVVKRARIAMLAIADHTAINFAWLGVARLIEETRSPRFPAFSSTISGSAPGLRPEPALALAAGWRHI
jgi:hypothetical protein